MSFQYRPFLYGQITISAAATLIVAKNSSSVGTLITNSGSNTVYLGDAGVTTLTGYPLAGGASAAIPTTGAIYGIASASGSVGYIQCQ